MKEIIKEETIVKTTHTFMAEDGKTFTDENACRCYERSLDSVKLENDYKRLVIGSPTFPYDDWCNDSFTVDIVKLKDVNDYYTVADYMHEVTYSGWEEQMPVSFPCVKVVCYTDGYGCFSNFSVKDLLEQALESYNYLLQVADSYAD